MCDKNSADLLRQFFFEAGIYHTMLTYLMFVSVATLKMRAKLCSRSKTTSEL